MAEQRSHYLADGERCGGEKEEALAQHEYDLISEH